MLFLENIKCFLLVVLMVSCVGGTDFEAISRDCSSQLSANLSFAELETLFKGETLQIQDDLVLAGYVTSSDRAGNFFNVLHIQDQPIAPTRGIQLEIELRDSHLFFEAGCKILVKLKGLYLGKSGETLKLGGTFSSFGNLSVGRLPALKVPEHLFLSCSATGSLQPTLTTIPELDTLMISTLLRLENMEVVETEIEQPFALPREETERTLVDCEANEISLRNSGFSDFQEDTLPAGNGAITGVLLKDGKNFQLAIRTLEDMAFTQERCPEIITEFTSTQIFISELADPDNNTGARFVELYNAALEPLDLNKWTLRRYTNKNTEVSSPVIDLSGIIIGAESTLVISSNATEFESAYGFAADLNKSGSGSPANSDGNDNIELVDPFGTVIDIFGVIGEDGSGTNHEFEDGRAVRKTNITEGNPTYTFTEWTIFNDTGAAGTINQPQNAPDDFAPGQRE